MSAYWWRILLDVQWLLIKIDLVLIEAVISILIMLTENLRTKFEVSLFGRFYESIFQFLYDWYKIIL